MVKIAHGTDVPYVDRRRRSYPDLGDQLGAVVKVLEHLHQQGIDIGDDGTDLVAQIRAVKERHPKA